MVKVPVKIVSWDEIVEWTRGLSQKIKDSGWTPDVVVAVARGGYVPARLLCDFLDITDLLSVQSQHWTEAARAAEKAILKYPYKVDMEGKNVLVVDDIVDTGETLLLARDYIRREWRPVEVKVAALQWISQVAKFEPDYYYLEVRDWTWFQYPWTRLEDLQQFIARILREDERFKDRDEVSLAELVDVFVEWYGVKPEDFGDYWELAISRLREKGYRLK
ncbi:MAG: phosphoribosyltransferase [Desulfurococcales archaeon]|nr:phosphoribosyltransferase [Desulfurococcales archaeon]